MTPDTYAAEARIYDALSVSLTLEDLPFYLEVARRCGGPVLELACGTGRILLPIVASVGAGAGVDALRSMIDHAKRHAATSGIADAVRLEVGDIRRVDLHEVYPLVIIPYSSLFQLPTEADLVCALVCAKRHLAPGGQVIADVFVPHLATMRARHDRTTFVGQVEDPDTGGAVLVWDHTLYTWSPGTVVRRRIYEDLDGAGVVQSRRYGRLDIYFRNPDQLVQAFTDAGLRVTELYGDFDRRPFDEKSPRVIVMAERGHAH